MAVDGRWDVVCRMDDRPLQRRRGVAIGMAMAMAMAVAMACRDVGWCEDVARTLRDGGDSGRGASTTGYAGSMGR